MPSSKPSAASPFNHILTSSFTSSFLLQSSATQYSFNLGPSVDYMLDAQELSSQTLEALLAFWQQRVGVPTVFTFRTTSI
jgi:hypothetical protein